MKLLFILSIFIFIKIIYSDILDSQNTPECKCHEDYFVEKDEHWQTGKIIWRCNNNFLIKPCNLPPPPECFCSLGNGIPSITRNMCVSLNNSRYPCENTADWYRYDLVSRRVAKGLPFEEPINDNYTIEIKNETYEIDDTSNEDY